MDKGFLFRRLGFLIPCVLKLNTKGFIELNNKHKISSLQDVFFNPFYWDALLKLKFTPKKVYDLGANFGLFTCLHQQIVDYQNNQNIIDYTLIEANKNLIKILKKNVGNLIPKAKTKIIYGAAGPNKNINFSTNSKNLLASKITTKGIEVPFVNFDLLEKPDLLKIDIEGAEEILFQNYFNWLKCAKAIIIEFHYEGEKLRTNQLQLINSGFKLVLEKMENSGYRNQLWVKEKS